MRERDESFTHNHGWQNSALTDTFEPDRLCQILSKFHFSVLKLVKVNVFQVCKYPCTCPVRELKCVDGVSVVKDGCGCCFMCARQHGAECSVRDVCDVRHGLLCDMSLGSLPGTGVCKGMTLIWINSIIVV